MKRNRIRRFLQQRQYAIASLVLFVAIAAMTGVYFSNRITQGQREEEIAKKEAALLGTGEDGQQEMAALDGKDAGQLMDRYADRDKAQDKEDATSVTSVIRPRETEGADGTDNAGGSSGAATGQGGAASQTERQGQPYGSGNQDTMDGMDDAGSKEQAGGKDAGNGKDGKDVKNAGDGKDGTTEGQEEGKQTQAKAADLHFSSDSELGWPLQGDVILNYSMDQTVYFATLDQYKYNPALIIAGKVNDPVKAAATGRITDISANEETGMTVTMDLGDGYSAVYGQLKEVLYKEGATVEAGNAIGYIAEPTKYYSVEGSNLYFALKKDDEPVNPMQFIE